MFPSLSNIKTNNGPAPNFSGLGGDNKASGPIATQNLGGDSQTQFMRSLQNYLASQGASTFAQGQGVTNAGIPGFGTAGDTTGTALGTTGTAMDTSKQALATLDPAQSYWTKLLSGDTQTMNEAIAPTATQAGLNYANAATNVATGAPRGGYAGVLAAGLPQAQAREVNTELYKLQPTAATNLNTIASTQGQLAGTQGQIGGIQNNIAQTQGTLANWLASLGIDISKLGLSQLDIANASLMAGRGQDVTEHGQAMNLAGQTAGTMEGGISSGVTKAIGG